MPTFVGELTLNQDQNFAALTAPETLNGRVLAAHIPSSTAFASTNGAVELAFADLSAHNGSPTPSHPTPTTPAPWTPSGGKRLNTGLAIVLENVASGFTHPNILDVKIGARLWADDAPSAKRQKLDDVSKQTTSGSLGFRIAGMKIWKGAEDAGGEQERSSMAHVETKHGYRCYDKFYGRSFTKQTVKTGFLEYFGGQDERGKLKSAQGKLAAKRMVSELESMEYVLENEESRMYSASILMVYEGDEEAFESALREEGVREAVQVEDEASGVDIEAFDGTDLDDEDNEDEDEEDGEESDPKVHDVRLIDFAHAKWTPGQGPDENALRGVRSILQILKEIAENV